MLLIWPVMLIITAIRAQTISSSVRAMTGLPGQRRLSRKTGSKKGSAKSNNYLKQLRRVNKIHRYIANQRLDNLHKISTEIANQYDVVCVENLNMRSMSNKGFGNGKATLDNGYGLFLNMLEYKLSDRGKYLVKVDKWFPSSQICHNCGTLHPK